MIPFRSLRMTSDMCLKKNSSAMSSTWYFVLLNCALGGITMCQDMTDKGIPRRNKTEDSALSSSSLLTRTIDSMNSFTNCCQSDIYLSTPPTPIIIASLESSIYSTSEFTFLQSTENLFLQSYLLNENSVNTSTLFSKELISESEFLSSTINDDKLLSSSSSSPPPPFQIPSTFPHASSENSLDSTNLKSPSVVSSLPLTERMSEHQNKKRTLVTSNHWPNSKIEPERSTEHQMIATLENSREECQSISTDCTKSGNLNAMNSEELASIYIHHVSALADQLNSTIRQATSSTSSLTENVSSTYITSSHTMEFTENQYDALSDAKPNYGSEKYNGRKDQSSFVHLHSSENNDSKTTAYLLENQELLTPIIHGSFKGIRTSSLILSKSETQELSLINSEKQSISTNFESTHLLLDQDTQPVSEHLEQLQEELSLTNINSLSSVEDDKLIVVTPPLSSHRKSKEVTDQTKNSLVEKPSQIFDGKDEPSIAVSLITEETKPSKFSIFHSDVNVDDLKSNQKNKTSRDESSPKMDDIISGIIHLLAGEVQMVRPPAHFHLGHSHVPVLRPPRPASTRINNRGPPTLISHSRTVVVFSQPDHHITLVPRPLHHQIPPRLRPTTMRRPLFTGPIAPSHAVGILPTRPEKFQVSTTSVVHLYKPLINPPVNVEHYGALPYDGEMFIAVAKPIMTESRSATPIAGLPPGIYTLANNGDELSSKITNNYEVFHNTPEQDAPTPADSHKNIKATLLLEVTNTQNFETQTFKLSSQSSRGETTVSKLSPFESKIPSGPITDWAPVFERPTMRFRPDSNNKNPSNSFATFNAHDDEVVIITQPTIFDLTVTNALAGVENPVRVLNKPNNVFLLDSTSAQSSFIENVLPSQDSFAPEKITTLEDSKIITNFKIYSSFVSLNNDDGIPILPLQTPELFESSTFKLHQSLDIASTSVTFLESSIPQTNYDMPSRPKDPPPVADMSRHRLTSFENFQRVSTKPHTTSNDINSDNIVTVLGRGTVHPAVMDVSSTIPQQFATSTSHSPEYSKGGTLLGRPIVIPVDIEEVRPYVGAINPPKQGLRPPKGGQHPSADSNPSSPTGVGNVQVAQAGINVAEDSRGRPVSPSRPHSPVQSIRPSLIRTPTRPRPNNPPVRIDTCIVGDDTTCDLNLNETCKMEQGVSSCLCRPGFARSLSRMPCLPVVSVMLSLKVDRLGDDKITFSSRYLNPSTEEYRLMEFEAKQALSSLFSYTAFSRNFLGVTVNKFYSIGGRLIINATVNLEEKESTRAPILRLQMRQEIVRAINGRNQNIGESRLYVEGPLNPVPAIEDVNECADSSLNDCSINGHCQNIFGTFQCKCKLGYTDSHPHDERQRGRQCSACSPDYCTNHGLCSIENGQKVCKCSGNYIGARCEIDSEVLGVALGASLAAIIIIILTLVCLCVWNRRWKREHHKQEVMSARSVNSNQTFSYLNKIANANTYRPTFEDRMRWAQISDVVGNGYMQSEPGMSQAQSSSTLGNQSVYAGPSRCQSPSTDELTWYNYNTRPRSRGASQSQSYVNGGFYDMDFSTRETYVGPSYAPSGRHQNSNTMRQYYK